MFSGLSQIPGLASFFFRGHVLPEKRYAERAVGIFECALEGFDIVHVGLHHLGSQFGERLGFLGVNVSCQGTCSELSTWICKDGADQTTPLRSSRACHCNDFLCHRSPLHLTFCEIEISASCYILRLDCYCQAISDRQYGRKQVGTAIQQPIELLDGFRRGVYRILLCHLPAPEHVIRDE